MAWQFRVEGIPLLVFILLGGCTVGPKYHTPSTPAPVAYKELTPADFPNTDGWKLAQPSDSVLRSKWWEMFNDVELNKLEEQVDISNQTIAAATANFYAARAIVRETRSQYFPTVTGGLSINESRQISTRATTSTAGTTTTSNSSSAFQGALYDLAFDATYVPDLWGRVRNQVRANVAAAQLSAADLANTRLTAQADLAVDYYAGRPKAAARFNRRGLPGIVALGNRAF
jgi:outer membrane protein TolC